MSGVNTTVKVTDGISKPTKKMNKGLSAVIKSFGILQKLTGKSVKTEGIQRTTEELDKSKKSADGLNSSLSKVMGTLSGMMAIKSVTGFINDATNAFEDQLNSANQLRTTLANMVGDGYEDAYKKIASKASEIQGRGMYGDEAMLAGAAEFATYFTDTDAIELMMDTLADYAAGMSGGGALDSSAIVNYATGLGKITNGAYDAMTKKGFTFTDAQKAIIEGTATEAQMATVLGENFNDLSEDMQTAMVISQVVGESWNGMYEAMSSTPQAKITSLKNTINDIKETVAANLYPAIGQIVESVQTNTPKIENLMMGITNVLGFILGLAGQIVTFVTSNWDIVLTVISGIIGLLLAWKAAQLLVLFTNPISYIVIGIIILFGLLGKFVKRVNETADSSISAVGIVSGALFGFLSTVGNVFVMMWNLVTDFVNFFANVFKDPIASVKVLFYDLMIGVISFISKIAEAIEFLINKIPGVQVDITTGLNDFRRKLEDSAAEVKSEAEWKEVVSRIDYLDIVESGKKGYELGKSLSEGIDNVLHVEDYYAEMKGKMGSISNDTDDISKSLEITSEDLKYLRDIAEQEAINRFTTAEIKIDMTNNNSIASNMDIDGIVSELEDRLYESMSIAAEGV